MIEKHQIYAKNILGLAKGTLQNYSQVLTKFEKFCLSSGVTLLTAREETIIDFVVSAPVKESTKYKYVSILRQFYKFLVGIEQIESNPTKRINSPQVPVKTHSTYTIEDIVRLINTENDDTAISIRNRTILELFYATGMRESELLALCLFDVDLDNNVLKVFGKGAKERLIPLNDIAVNTLKYYMEHRHRLLENAPKSSIYLFTSSKSLGKPMSRGWLWRFVKDRAKKAGLDKQFTVHSLRHCFATHILQNGANLRVIQELLGHSNIQTTQIYTHFDRQRLKEMHQKYHPRA